MQHAFVKRGNRRIYIANSCLFSNRLKLFAQMPLLTGRVLRSVTSTLLGSKSLCNTSTKTRFFSPFPYVHIQFFIILLCFLFCLLNLCIFRFLSFSGEEGVGMDNLGLMKLLRIRHKFQWKNQTQASLPLWCQSDLLIVQTSQYPWIQ